MLKRSYGHIRKLKPKSDIHLSTSISFAIVFAAIGLFTLFHTFAAPAPNGKSAEAETASTSQNTAVVADAAASGGNYLAFNAAPTPAPTPTPTPPPVGGCALPAFPNASCTGVPAGVTLTAYTGTDSPAANTVIDGKLITKCMSISQPGVIIKNSRMTGQCSYAVDAWIASGQANWVQIIDSEIICTNAGSGIGERGVIVRRVEISGCENGMDLDQDALVEDSYIHSLDEGPDGEGHGDGIQSAIFLNITIRHNTIIGRSGDLNNPGNNATSAIITPPTGQRNSLVEYNFLAGGASSIYCRDHTAVNVRVINNTFAHKPGPLGAAFFYATECGAGSVIFTGNVTDTGQAVVPE